MQGYPRVTHLLAPFLKFEFIVSVYSWLYQCLQRSTFKCYSINKSTRRRFSKLKLNLKNDNRRNRRRREINKTSLCQRQTKQSFVSLLLRRWWSFKFEENCFEEKKLSASTQRRFFFSSRWTEAEQTVKNSRTIWISFKFFLSPKYFSLKEPTLKFQFRARFSKLLSQYLLSLVFTFSDFSVLPEGQKDSWTVLLELFRLFGF